MADRSVTAEALPEEGVNTYPRSDAPVVTTLERIVDPSAQIPSFGEDKWSLDAIEKKSTIQISFETWPEAFRLLAKHTVFAFINHGNPDCLVNEPYSKYAAFPSASSIRQVMRRLRQSLSYLVDRYAETDTPLDSPADLDSDHLDELKKHLEATKSKGTTASILEYWLRAWHLNPWLPPDLQWPQPNYGREATQRSWRPPGSGGDNRTEPLPQAIIGPLLHWSLRISNDYAEDAIDAYHHFRQRIAASFDKDEAYRIIGDYLWNERPFPTLPHNQSRVCWTTLAYRHGIDKAVLSGTWKRIQWSRQRGFKSGGRLWHDAPDMLLSNDPAQYVLDYRPKDDWLAHYTVQDMLVHGDSSLPRILELVRTSGLTPAAYLTGARPEEVELWRTGCTEAYPTESGTVTHLVQGKVFKGEWRTLENDETPDGVDAVWTTVPEATNAIVAVQSVLDAFASYTDSDRSDVDGNPLLFGSGSARRASNDTNVNRLRLLIEFINHRVVPHTSTPTATIQAQISPRKNSHPIATDQDGVEITLSRFRRTLAWFIRNQPNGDVTLALQYQQLGVRVGEGYAGTQEAGFTDLLDAEDRAHRARVQDSVQELLEHGGRLYGPAAERAGELILSSPRRLMPGEERRTRKDPAVVIYENDASALMCVYYKPTALCAKLKNLGRDLVPDLNDCRLECHNITRTDSQVQQLRTEIAALRESAKAELRPMAQSMLALAQQMEDNLERELRSQFSFIDVRDVKPSEEIDIRNEQQTVNSKTTE